METTLLLPHGWMLFKHARRVGRTFISGQARKADEPLVIGAFGKLATKTEKTERWESLAKFQSWECEL